MTKEQEKRKMAMEEIYKQIVLDESLKKEIEYCSFLCVQKRDVQFPSEALKIEMIKEFSSFAWGLITILLHNKKIMVIK